VKRCIVFTLLLLAVGCSRTNPDAPPTVYYGESVCTECGMIVSDERFASAVIIRDNHGRLETLVFDDVGDQVIYEKARPELDIVRRWVHDYAGTAWIPAESAHYVKAAAIHTPMASGIVAFADPAAAEAMAKEHGVEVIRFSDL
jgi:copper chaperone NosL